MTSGSEGIPNANGWTNPPAITGRANPATLDATRERVIALAARFPLPGMFVSERLGAESVTR